MHNAYLTWGLWALVTPDDATTATAVALRGATCWLDSVQL